MLASPCMCVMCVCLCTTRLTDVLGDTDSSITTRDCAETWSALATSARCTVVASAAPTWATPVPQPRPPPRPRRRSGGRRRAAPWVRNRRGETVTPRALSASRGDPSCEVGRVDELLVRTRRGGTSDVRCARIAASRAPGGSSDVYVYGDTVCTATEGLIGAACALAS